MILANGEVVVLERATSRVQRSEPRDRIPSSRPESRAEELTTVISGDEGRNKNSGADGDYTEFSGTSAATPQIAGLAALLFSLDPTQVNEVDGILKDATKGDDRSILHPRGCGLREGDGVRILA